MLLFFPRTPCVRSYVWPTNTYCYPNGGYVTQRFVLSGRPLRLICEQTNISSIIEHYFGYNAESLYGTIIDTDSIQAHEQDEDSILHAVELSTYALAEIVFWTAIGHNVTNRYGLHGLRQVVPTQHWCIALIRLIPTVAGVTLSTPSSIFKVHNTTTHIDSELSPDIGIASHKTASCRQMARPIERQYVVDNARLVD